MGIFQIITMGKWAEALLKPESTEPEKHETMIPQEQFTKGTSASTCVAKLPEAGATSACLNLNHIICDSTNKQHEL